MESYLIYIGKVSLAAGAFYIAYLVLFQNQKHFVFNRIYLPVSLALSFVIPLITFTTVKFVEPATASFDFNSFAHLGNATENVVQPVFVFEWYHYLFGLYIFGVVGFLFHLLLGHLKAISIVRKSQIRTLFETLVHVTKKDVHPFSFFNKIVLSENTLDHPNLQLIVSHENIHVKEKHTLDILFAELLFLAQWFNPFAWLIKDAVKNNLEYKTDHEIAKTNNPQEYQLAMVGLADKEGVAPFLTALNGSQLKNRIIMMKKKTENKYAFVKQLVVLPLLAILVMGLSNKEIRTEVVQTEISSSEKTIKGVVTNENGEPLPGVAILIKDKTIGTISDSDGNYEIKLEDENETLVFVMTGFVKREMEVGEKTVINAILKAENNSKHEEIIINTFSSQKTDAEQEKKYGGPVFSKAEEMPEFPGGELALKKYIANSIKYPEIAQENGIQGKVYVSFIIDKEGKVINPHISKGVDPVLDKESLRIVSTLPRWKPGKQRGEIVRVSYTIPITFALQDKSQTNDTSLIKPPQVVKILSYGNDDFSEALYIVNGIETNSLEDIDPDNIKSIDVLKDKSATELYGEKGKNGVILVTTKNPVKFNPGIPGNPIVIVDGKEFDSIEDADVPSEEIASVSVLKNETASTKIYGERAKNGVIVINTKTKYNSLEEKPLIVIDGTISSYKSMDDIDPETIQSINVLKDEKAAEKYGDKGKNGVLEITMKPLKIDTELKLRKFIANAVKYPVLAQKANREKTVQLFATVDKKGKIAEIHTKSSKNAINLSEVVVTGYKNTETTTGYPTREAAENAQKTEEQLLVNETIRVIRKIPAIDIKEYKGKTVEVKVNFQLQDDTRNNYNIQNNLNDIFIPEGFSPNGDGIHDVFEVKGLVKKYPNFQMKILNSNRDLIWEYKHNGDPNSIPEWWNGKDNKNNIEKGTYYYVIEYNGDSGITNSAGIFILSE